MTNSTSHSNLSSEGVFDFIYPSVDMYGGKIPKVTIVTEASNVINKIKNSRGCANCLACGANGYVLDDNHYGYPSDVKVTERGPLLQHKPNCPMNAILKKDGTLKTK